MPKKLMTTFLALVLIFGTLTTWGLMTTIVETQSQIVSQQNTLIDLQIDLIDLQEKILANINTVWIEPTSGQQVKVPVDIHVIMYHWREGELLEYSRNAGVLTVTGLEWIEDQLGDAAVAEGDYIGHSNSTDTPSSGWSILPDEVTTGSMGRAQGTYADDGTGQWNITRSFSPSESNSSQVVGLYYSAYPASSLIASDTITLINYQSGDTVTITFQITAAQG